MLSPIRAFIISSVLYLLPTVLLSGGEVPPLKVSATGMAAPTATSDWEWYVSLPTWAAGLRGETGVAGFEPVAVDVAFKDILRNLDMTGALTVEARHRRWSFIADGLYLKMSASGETPDPLLSSVDVEVQQVLAEFAMAYRLWEGKRGYLDVLAGARYVHVKNELNFHLDSASVRQVSEVLSEAAVNRAVNKFQDQVRDAAERAGAQLPTLNLDEQAATLRQEARDRAVEKILAETTIREIVQTIRDLTPAQRVLIRKKVENSREVLAANKALAQAVFQDHVTTAIATARKQAQRAVIRAKKQLADAIESAIRHSVPEHVSASNAWVDPFVGLRGRYNLTDKVYFAARADVGGFGIASDITWNACGAIGCQLSNRWSTELGWRHLAIDYEEGGFVFDADMSGLFLGLTCKL